MAPNISAYDSHSTLVYCGANSPPSHRITRMAKVLGFMVLLALSALICEAAMFKPISDSHRSAALELFTPTHGSFSSLEETYEALRTFEVLGIEKQPDIRAASCASVVDTLSSSSSALNDLFQALRVNGILKCELNKKALAGIAPRLKDAVNNAISLLDYYYSVGSLVLVKGLSSIVELHLESADSVFRAIKAFGQSDGRWRYSSNNPESSTYAAGIALESLAGIISLASSEIDQSLISMVKNDISNLFDGLEKYDDGAYYFDEKLVDGRGHQCPLSASSAVVRGVTAFAAVSTEKLNLPGDKILGLARFLLGAGVPGNAKDLYYQIDALASLENNRVSIPLVLSLPASVLSLTRKNQLKVNVNTVLGSAAPSLTVKLKQIFSSGSKDASVIDQDLKFDHKNAVHYLDALPKDIDVGSYIFSFEVFLHDSDHKTIYATGGRTKVPIYITGAIKVDNAEIAVLDNDIGNVETQKKLDFAGENAISLSANHLQKLRLSFQLTSPLGHAFKPHQAFLKLRHESKVDHIFVVGNSGKQFEIILDFLGLVEKFFYLSGRYDIQLTVGDAVMENSFLQPLGSVELDLPEPPEKAARPPPQAVDPSSRFGPKAEIAHVFRVPEKRPPRDLSYAFLALVLLPFLGFLVGLLRLHVNLKNFPTASGPAMFAILFHLLIAAVLSLYVLFWSQWNLFQTLRALGFLGIFLLFVGHRTLSHLASTSAKLKSA
ncbi:dolichyl-diphosphooligosaccharide--protein glycosyltransferase subunit 2 isoform X2 [Nicotiana tabacum]|uniref:Dolichyl-diphosphooligosaccharide--protein glycosyltransferase subunit 2 n=1 Tax=Nicotiana tabacum TaxID=4097 RepID=A0A1S3Z5F3_TOBAC|nr:PREDICTED: dolichyl-diphosphooligosaccharide--protein glycosyltransferase subunit 2-like [Nicotiana tabacum]